MQCGGEIKDGKESEKVGMKKEQVNKTKVGKNAEGKREKLSIMQI